MALDPSMQAAPDLAAAPVEATPEAPGGFVVELKVTADGKMSVSVEPMTEEAPAAPSADGTAPAAPEDDSQPVANLGEALKLIREIVTHGGEQTDVGAGQDEMAAGYGKDGM